MERGVCRECLKPGFTSDMKSGGGNWAGGKYSINDGGGMVGNVNECWREANGGSQTSSVVVASTSTGGCMD